MNIRARCSLGGRVYGVRANTQLNFTQRFASRVDSCPVHAAHVPCALWEQDISQAGSPGRQSLSISTTKPTKLDGGLEKHLDLTSPHREGRVLPHERFRADGTPIRREASDTLGPEDPQSAHPDVLRCEFFLILQLLADRLANLVREVRLLEAWRNRD